MVTIQGVLDEIKNKRQLKRMVVLPYDIKVIEPTPESIRTVSDFSKKTGDFGSLSVVDLKVIALTYQLEVANVGVEHLRKEPVMAKTIVRVPKAGEELVISKDGFFPKHLNQIPDETEEHLATETTDECAIDDEELAAKFAKLDCQVDESEENVEVLKKVDELEEYDDDDEDEEDESAEVYDDDEGEAVPEVEDDDNDGWITPSNVKAVKREMTKDIRETKPVIVACMTTDFSVQNVCKQIGLNLSAIDGRVIKETRTFVLRCYTCFHVTTLVHKVFCPKCGHKTLKRCSVSINSDGQQTIHINVRRPLTARGKNKSLPRPQGGKHSTNPILFEDQPIPKQMPSRVARTKTNALDEDYIAGYSPFVRRDVDSKSALLRTKGSIRDMMRNHEFQNVRRTKK